MNKRESLVSSAIGIYKKLERVELKMRIKEMELMRTINRMTEEEFDEYARRTTEEV